MHPIFWFTGARPTALRTPSIAAALAVLLSAGISTAQTSVRAVSLTTVDPVPGVPNGATRFANTLTGAVVINNGGAAAFASSYSTAGGGPSGSGIWCDSSGTLAPLAFAGDVAPGTQGPTAGDTFMSFSGVRITLSDNNRVAFAQQLNGAFSPWGCWQHDGAVLACCALTGQDAPSAPPGLWSLSNASRVNQSNNGRVALRSGFAVGNGTYQSVHVGVAGNMPMCTRNEVAGDTNGFVTLGETLISSRLTTCFSAPYRNVEQGVIRPGIWSGPCAGASNVVSHALLVPGYVGLPAQTAFSQPTAFDFSGTGGFAYSTGLSGTGITAANDTAVWMADASSVRLLAREGDQVPGLPDGCFYSDFLSGTLVGPFISGNAHVVFVCTINGPGVTGDASRIIALKEPGSPVRVIARTGTQMPGYPAGINILSFGGGVAINSWGDVVFTASTFSPPPGRGAQAVFCCPAGGVPAILVESNQPLTVRPGVTARLSGITEPLGSGGDDGLPRNWNDRRQYAFKATWTDVNNVSGSGIFVASAGVCNADLGAAGGVTARDGLLDNNDFIAFISLFFVTDGRADMGLPGGVPGSDGQFDNNDFIAFINAFFNGYH
ncbi:MAG: GC-type dockerin domain-anchored protein [Phycisphaerales bacterium]